MKSVMLEVPVVGTAGTSPARAGEYGLLRGAWVDYTGQPGTCVLTVTETLGGVTRTLFTLSAQNADRAVTPVTQGQDSAGANVSSVYVEGIPLFGGRLAASIASGSAAAIGARVTLLIED